MIELIALALLVLLGAGFFSCIEAALFALPRSRVMLLKQQERKGANALALIKGTMQQAIIVIVIGNNIVNIAGSMFVGVVAASVFGDAIIGIISALMTILIIIFGEIVPKTIGENNAEKISLFIAPALVFTIRILSPIIRFLEKLPERFVIQRNIVSEEELTLLSELGHREGSIEADELDMIRRVFTLNDLTAKDIMTPRTMIVGFPQNAILSEIRDDIFTLTNSRLPVYGNDLDDIVGLCYRRDLLIALANDESQKTVSDFTQKVVYVQEDMRVDNLLKLFLKKREHLAIVKDSFDGTSGLVTLEDVLEQLVGEIVDETDEVVDTRKQAEHNAQASDLVVEK